ncbi:hypothetical protein A3758_15635 [Oleiphilus sp. HI0118]|nr:hypothetical protein A3758_15635 [Oleiphilus sp. HI0118]
MLKKTLLSAAIASTFALSGCLDSSPDTGENAGSVTNPDTSTAVYPIFSPAESKLPIPNDLIFDSEAGDGSFSVSDTSPPVTTALNGLSGASTIAPIDISLSGLIDPASIKGPGDADQNVWLIALDYASGDPVQGLSNQEPPNVAGVATPPVPADIVAAQPTYTVEHKVLDGNSTIRIHPVSSPLAERTRFVVAITNGITDTQGNAIVPSPGAAGYEALTKTDAEVPLNGALAALAPVRALINGLWETTSLGLINAVRGLVYSQPPLTEDNIALTYSFTTSDDEKVLDYIAEPTNWLNDRIQDLIKVGAAKAAVEGGAGDYATVKATVDGAYSAWLPSSLSPALAGCDAAPAGDARVTCAANGLYGALGGTATFTSQPTTTTITMNGVPTDVTAVVPSLAGSIPADTVWVDQGKLTIPYYSGAPSGFPTPPTETTAAAGAGLPLKYASWEPDVTLATTLNITFYCSGLAIPQGFTAPALGSTDQLDCSDPMNPPSDPADFDTPPASEVVNYIFPFPTKQEDVTIPMLAIYPNPAMTGGAQNLKTMMWGHGLTGDRSNALGFGSLLVANSLSNASLHAVIAIDEPLHGVVSGALEASAFGAVERHFGFQDAGAGATNPPALIEDGGSGSMFINLESFLTARDNNRQHVLDLFTVRKSLPATTLSGHTLTDNYFYSGHSLGTINSQAFVAIANDTAATDDNITAAAFFTPGGGIARFFENSPAFASTLADGLAANGITPETSNYQAYLNVFQAAFDSVDAVSFADRFDGATPVNYFVAANDLVIPVDISEESRTFQSVTSPGGNTVSGSVAYLSGAEPLVALSGATALTTTAGNQAITQAVARYKPCSATHSTPSLPDGSDVPDAATYGNNAFVENLSHTVGLIASDGAAVTVTPNFASLQQDLPLPALILDEASGCTP